MLLLLFSLSLKIACQCHFTLGTQDWVHGRSVCDLLVTRADLYFQQTWMAGLNSRQESSDWRAEKAFCLFLMALPHRDTGLRLRPK